MSNMLSHIISSIDSTVDEAICCIRGAAAVMTPLLDQRRDEKLSDVNNSGNSTSQKENTETRKKRGSRERSKRDKGPRSESSEGWGVLNTVMIDSMSPAQLPRNLLEWKLTNTQYRDSKEKLTVRRHLKSPLWCLMVRSHRTRLKHQAPSDLYVKSMQRAASAEDAHSLRRGRTKYVKSTTEYTQHFV